MEIEIPDLQDLQFTSYCWKCQGRGGYKLDKSGRVTFPSSGECPDVCSACKGNKIKLTTVGSRLVEFLKLIGLDPKVPDWLEY